MLHLPHKHYLTLLILGGILLVGGAFFIWLTRNSQATITVDQLSPRAQEFIAKENSDGSGLWSTVNLASPPVHATQSSTLGSEVTTPCFSLNLPSPATNAHLETTAGSCRWEAKMTRPLSHVVIGNTVSTSHFDENTGVQFRRRSPDIYQESRLTLTQFEQVSVFRAADELTVFAQTDAVLFTIGFTGSTHLDSLDESALSAMLESLRWPNSR